MQFDLFDARAGKPMPPGEEASLPGEPASEESARPTEEEEREATELFDGMGAKLITLADRARERASRAQFIEESLRRIGRSTSAPLLDAAERRRLAEEERRKRNEKK